MEINEMNAVSTAPEVDTSVPGFDGCVVLGRAPGQNAYQGVVELSFGMDMSPDRVRFWWTGTGTDNIFGLKHTVDGFKDAERHREMFQKSRPDWAFETFNIDDPNLPIVIDWPRWHAERERKFEDRNPAFSIKD
jgi:hypothetical protein